MVYIIVPGKSYISIVTSTKKSMPFILCCTKQVHRNMPSYKRIESVQGIISFQFHEGS